MRCAAWIEIGPMDELARLDTPVHRLDARAKVVVTLAFIAVVSSFPPRTISALTPLLLYPVALLALGRIPPRSILRKLLVAAPFALAVAVCHPLLDRRPAAAVGGLELSRGWLAGTSILLRYLLTVSAVLLLVACTGMQQLGAALEQLGAPRALVRQLLFLHRYLFVVAREGGRLRRAVALRAAGTRALRPRVYGALVGQWLLRSLDRAERVHRAMVARGFQGVFRTPAPAAWRWTDWGFVAGCLAGLAAARAWNLAALCGRGLAGALR